MKDILKEFLKFLVEVLRAVDYKTVIYKSMKSTVLPLLAKKVEDTSSKIDDVIYKGIEQLVEKFLAPPPVKIDAPSA